MAAAGMQLRAYAAKRWEKDAATDSRFTDRGVEESKGGAPYTRQPEKMVMSIKTQTGASLADLTTSKYRYYFSYLPNNRRRSYTHAKNACTNVGMALLYLEDAEEQRVVNEAWTEVTGGERMYWLNIVYDGGEWYNSETNFSGFRI